MYGKVIRFISRALWGICALFTLVVGVIGIVMHIKYGFYPPLRDVFSGFKGVDIDSLRNRSYNDAFGFMSSTVFVPAIAFLIQYNLAILINFEERIVRPIISILISIGFWAFALSKTMRNIFGGFIVIGLIVILAGLVWSFIGTKGGIVLLISFGVCLFHLPVFPFIMLLIGGWFGRIILVLVVLAVILIIVCIRFKLLPSSSESSSSSSRRSSWSSSSSESSEYSSGFGSSGYSSGFGSSGYSSGSKSSGSSNSEIDKEVQKKRNEIAAHERSIEDAKRAIRGYQNHEIGYALIDEKVLGRKIEDEKETIKMLERQIEKLESKRK